MEGTRTRPGQQLTASAAYALLFLAGATEGLIGCFQFSRSAGSVPLAAIGFCVLILASAVLAGAGMGSPLGGLATASGWFVVSFALTLPTHGGSVIINDSSAGKWYLYGGAVCAGVGIAAASRWRPRREALAGHRPEAPPEPRREAPPEQGT